MAASLLLLAAIAPGFLAEAEDSQSAPIAEALKYEGLRIVQISFEPADQPLSRDELLRRLPFRTGGVFHERSLQEAIQNLYATGRFADLAVDATHIGNGVALRIITQTAYFVGRVVVLGVKPPPNIPASPDQAR